MIYLFIIFYFYSSSKLKIAKYEKTYQSSLAARMLLFTADSEKENGNRIVNKVMNFINLISLIIL